MKGQIKHHVFILAAAAALVFTQEVLAAEGTSQMAKPNFAIAPSIGLSSFSLKGDDAMGSKSGISVGAWGAMQSGVENLEIEAGLEYLQAGGKESVFFASVETNLDYLSLPLGARYRALAFGEKEQNAFFLRGGIAPALLLSAKYKASVLGYSEEQDIKDSISKTDVFAYLGAGGTYAMGDTHEIVYDVRYMRGLQKATVDSNTRNEGLIASVAYSIPL